MDIQETFVGGPDPNGDMRGLSQPSVAPSEYRANFALGAYLREDQVADLQRLPALQRAIADAQRQRDECKFRRLAEQWHRETKFLSRVKQMVIHPAYQRIIGMGQAALPFILRELSTKGGHWFWALNAITGDDPSSEAADYDQARAAWLEWGQDHGYQCLD